MLIQFLDGLGNHPLADLAQGAQALGQRVDPLGQNARQQRPMCFLNLAMTKPIVLVKAAKRSRIRD
ncbi:hypothetical protein FDU21_09990 [Xanthomonas oryzae pv. oryzae]|nr:hypothetical protein FDU21_09990 [Xanthomonas oryzae pv. oryzae]